MFIALIVSITAGIFIVLETLTVHRRIVIAGLASAIVASWLLAIIGV